MILFYVRHGDPIYDPDSLTEFGLKQADALAPRFKKYGLDKIYASTSNRAILTATPTAKALGLEIEQLDWCHEGYTYDDFALENSEGQKRWSFHIDEWINFYCSKEVKDMGFDWYKHPKCAGYNFENGIKRVRTEGHKFLKDLGFEYNEEKGMYKVNKPKYDKIGLFAHQGFGLTFLSCILDIPFPTFVTKFDIYTSSVTVVEFDESREYTEAKVIMLSNDSHMYAGGLDLPYKY